MKFRKIITYSLTVSLLFGLNIFYGIQYAKAGTMTALSDTVTRSKVGIASSHTILFTTSQSDLFVPNATVTVDFHEDESGYVVNGSSSTVTDFDFKVGATETAIIGIDGDCTGHTGTSDVVVSINDTTGLVTFKACGSYSAGSSANFSIKYGTAATNGGSGTNRVINPATPDLYAIDLGGNIGDTGAVRNNILTEDQIAVTASVDPIISFSITDAAIGFGTLAGTNVKWATSDTLGSSTEPDDSNPTTINSSSNAKNGYTITIKSLGNGSTAGLFSAGAASLINADGSNQVIDNASFAVYSAYAKYINASDSFSVASGFDGGTSTQSLNINNQTIASTSAPSGNSNFDLALKVVIKPTTPAGAYTDTLTLVCTGNF